MAETAKILVNITNEMKEDIKTLADFEGETIQRMTAKMLEREINRNRQVIQEFQEFREARKKEE